MLLWVSASECYILFIREVLGFRLFLCSYFLFSRRQAYIDVGVISPKVMVTCVGWELLVGLFD